MREVHREDQDATRPVRVSVAGSEQPNRYSTVSYEIGFVLTTGVGGCRAQVEVGVANAAPQSCDRPSQIANYPGMGTGLSLISRQNEHTDNTILC